MLIDDLFSLQGKIYVVVGGGGVLAGEIAHVSPGREWLSFSASKYFLRAGWRSLRSDPRSQPSTPRLPFGLRSTILAASISCSSPRESTPRGLSSRSRRRKWGRIVDVDLRSVFLTCQVFGKAMIDTANRGSITNISSASSGPPLSKVLPYSVPKPA